MAQLLIPAHIETCQLIAVALQSLQFREKLYARKIRNPLPRDINLRYLCNFNFRQDAITRCVEAVLYIGTEVLIRKLRFVHRNTELD